MKAKIKALKCKDHYWLLLPHSSLQSWLNRWNSAKPEVGLTCIKGCREKLGSFIWARNLEADFYVSDINFHKSGWQPLFCWSWIRYDVFLCSLFCIISYFIQSSTELPHLLCQSLQTCSQTKLCIKENKINPPYLVHLHPWTHGMTFQIFCPLLNIQNSFPISSGISIFHL